MLPNWFKLPKCFTGLAVFGFPVYLGIFNKSSSTALTENITTTTTVSKTAGQTSEAGALNVADVNRSSIVFAPTDHEIIREGFDFAKESQALFGENFNSVTGLIERRGESQDFLVTDLFGRALGSIDRVNDKSLASQRVVADALNLREAQTQTGGVAAFLPVITGGILIGGVVMLARVLKG